jgi:hypothetical protein
MLQLGMYMATEACYNPRAAPLVWRYFREGDADQDPFPFFSTHPPHEVR